jgi:hypothetical protein
LFKIDSIPNLHSNPFRSETTSTLNSEGIGVVTLRRSRRARRIIISVSAAKGVRVSVPYRTSLQKAIGFVEVKKAWIQKHLVRIEQNERQKQASGFNRAEINQTEANNKLTTRTRYLAELHGFVCNKITVRKQRTRWGSCSPKNNISLNINLILLPDLLLDYVILHELVHTRIHNHSKKFWAELDNYVPDSKQVSRQLRKNEMILL